MIKKVPKRRFKGFLNAGDWEQRKLGELLEQPITDGPHETPELYDSGIPFISVDAIIDNKIDFTKMRGCISKEYDDICAKKYKPQINDVYLVKSGATIGKVAIVDTYDDFNIWSPLAAMRCGSITNPYFLYVLLQTKDLQTQVFNKASHGTQPNLSMRQLETFACKVPKIEEQILISRFFKRLNDSITLHQRKLEKLQATKKALLYELFPIENSRRPKLRFKGFTGDWEQRKLGEIFEYLQNNTLSRDSLNYKNPNVKNIHYGDILVKFDEILDGSNKDIPYINSEVDLSKFSKSLLRDGDIIFSDTAEDDTVGKAIELQNVNAPFILSGLHTIPCRPLIPFGKGYLGNFLNSDSYRLQLRPLVQGIKVSSISKSALKDTMIEYPKNLDEQEKIGSLFYYIAKMITLHQRKLEKLKNLKAAYLNEMFV